MVLNKRDVLFPDFVYTNKIRELDGPLPLAVIDYDPEYMKTLEVFHYILENEEISMRAYYITAEVLKKNTGNYHAWYWRRRCIHNLNIEIEKERKFVQDYAQKNLKSYQIWYHRRWLVEISNEYQDEIPFIESMLQCDAKNYNAWQLRTYIVEKYNLWGENELEFVTRMIDDDCRNNSAWTYRRFLMNHKIDEIMEENGIKNINEAKSHIEFQHQIVELIKGEVEYCRFWFTHTPHNESLYRYIQGFLYDGAFGNSRASWERKIFVRWENLTETVLPLMEKILDEKPSCRFALEFLMHCYYANELWESAVSATERIITADSIREDYWTLVKREILMIKKEREERE